MSTGIYIVGGTWTSNKNLWILEDTGSVINILQSYAVGSIANINCIARSKVDGSFYFGTSSGVVYKYNSDLSLATGWATGGAYTVGAAVYGVAVDSSGYLAIGYSRTSAKTCRLLNSAGVLVWSVQSNDYVTHEVGFDTSGNVICCGDRLSGVGYGGRYQRSNGALLNQYWVSSGGGYYASALWVSTANSDVVMGATISGGHSVRRCTVSDSQIWKTVLSVPTCMPLDVALDSNQNAFLGTSLVSSKSLFKFNSSGIEVAAYNTGALVQVVDVNLVDQVLQGGASSVDQDGNTAVFRVFNANLQLLRYLNTAAITQVLAIEGTTAVAPVITDQSVSQSVNVGDAVSLYVTATGTPDPTYQWYFGGDILPGETNNTLNFTADPSDAGVYTCTATNFAGSDTSDPIVLSVGSPPNITSQSGDKVALNGTEVTLFVVATGSPTPTYQWYRNSVLISGATSSTYVFFPTFSDAGSYTCTATNAVGSDISDPIEVAVVSNSYRYNAFLLPLDPDRS